MKLVDEDAFSVVGLVENDEATLAITLPLNGCGETLGELGR